MPVHVRLARIEEAESFCEIEDGAGMLFTTAPGYEWIAHLGNREPEEWAAAIREKLCWAADNDAGETVGVVAARQAGADLFVVELAVVTAEQRRGIGGALLDVVEAHARDNGLRAVTLTTFRDVPWNAPAYARRGYAQVESETMPAYLRAILAEEATNGLPPDLRCAMALVLQQ